MQCARCFPAVVLVVALTGVAGRSSADAPLVPEVVRQLMQDRDYAAAIKAIDEAGQAQDAPKDYLAFLKGRAQFLTGSYDEAIATFERLQQEFPESPWVRQARFAAGLALARKGDFQSAELIYRAEAEYLLSADRKQQIADIYLEFADEYFKPPEPDDKPDYEKALTFYQEALKVGAKPDKQIEVELLVARCQQELGKTDEAAKLYEQFVATHTGGSLNVEARFRLGECLFAQGNVRGRGGRGKTCWPSTRIRRRSGSPRPAIAWPRAGVSRSPAATSSSAWAWPRWKRSCSGFPRTSWRERPIWASPRATSTAAATRTRSRP